MRAWFALLAFTASDVVAAPMFARRYETSCNTCHQGHYPRLNAFGRSFKENGYQLPPGAEDIVRARRQLEPGTTSESLTIFKEVPLSLRGEVFAVGAHPESKTSNVLETRVFSYMLAGGTVGPDVSYFFAWTPFPEASLHQARLGLHNIGASVLGEGTLSAYAGMFLLLDFQRPAHRALAPGPSVAGSVPVGFNTFGLDEPNLGVMFFGRPTFGAWAYQLAIVAGDRGDNGIERDDWKDVFGRASYTFAHNTAHELTLGLFGYAGRAEMESVGDVDALIRDDFALAGADLEWDVGPINVAGMAYGSRHQNPGTADPVSFVALRGDVTAMPWHDFVLSLRYEQVLADDNTGLAGAQIAPHVSYLILTNCVASLVWRYDVERPRRGTALIATLDAAF